MAVTWTKNQQKVIDARNKNILVSAAAGSGKTAVLVERIIAMVTDAENSIDIDKLLVVTFTNAAAAEMRERILLAIEKKSRMQPDNEHLQKQLSYIHNAMITTIHSFCLNTIRENFNTINIDPSFRIGDEGELKLLKSDIVKELLEDYYEESSEDFINFIESYVTGKSDQNIEDMILKIYEFSMSHPWPEQWLAQCVENYQVKEDNKLGAYSWMKYLNGYIDLQLDELLIELSELVKTASLPDGPFTYIDALQSDMDYIQTLIDEQDFSRRSEIMSNYKFVRLSAKRLPDVDLQKKEQIKSGRDGVKKTLQKIYKSYYFQSEQDMLSDLFETGQNVKVLTALVLDFKNRYTKSKRENNILDFNDLEHYALEVLVQKNENGEIYKTEAAEEIAQSYVEIMIDEYQDSNLVQETILTSVSKESAGKPNIFMVGDVKQSIYKFRLARPEIFMEKYHAYPTDDGGKYQRINLDKNFRSRSGVLSNINFIFYQIMGESLGNINYDSDNELYPGAEYYPELPKGQQAQTELMILDMGDHSESEAQAEMLTVEETEEEIEYTKMQLEAKMVAEKIKELVNGYQIYDKDTGGYQTAKYSDIVILLRSLKNWGDTYVDILMAEGVPAYCESRVGYFESVEITTLLNLLVLIDNPLQDIPLAATLKSPIANLTSLDLARIKIIMGEERISYYEGIRRYAELGSEQNLIDKLEVFLTKLESYRVMQATTSIYDLIDHIIKDTGYYSYVTAMPAGDKRAGNIDILKQKAIDYESTSYVGLFNFVRYIEKLRKYDVDFGEASTIGENDNTVRIMSIHKSKGLEFPIVFVGSMAKQFNFMDTYQTVVVEQDMGIGLDFRDPLKRIKCDTLIKKGIAAKIKLENLGEELRVLYVALTRAKEKLILVGSVKDADKTIQKWINNRYYENNLLSFNILSKTNNFLDWIGYSLVRHKSFAALCKEYNANVNFSHELYGYQADFSITRVNLADLSHAKMEDRINKDTAKENLLNWSSDSIYNENIHDIIMEQLSFEYAYINDSAIHTKMSVSEIKKAYMEADEEVRQLIQPSQTEIIPAFIKGQEKVRGADKGTAYHRVFELMDFSIEADTASIEKMLEKMLEAGKINPETADVIDTNIILEFYQSQLYTRMKEAYHNHNLYREQQFVMGIPAIEVNAEYSEDELVLIQGIIDVYFEEPDGLVIADYKTDNVKTAEELTRRYTVQLEYYKKALQQITGKNVKEMLLYSTTLKCAVSIV